MRDRYPTSPESPAQLESEAVHDTPKQLFEADQARVMEIVPSISTGVAVLGQYTQLNKHQDANRKDVSRTRLVKVSQEGEPDIEYNRNMARLVRGNATIGKNLLYSSVHLATNKATLEESLAAGREAFDDSFFGLFNEQFEMDYYGSIVEPIATKLWTARATSEQVAEEVAATQADLSQRYELIKAFATPDSPTNDPDNPLLPSTSLTILSTLSDSPVRQELIGDLGEGKFDKMIARELLGFVHGKEQTNRQLARVSQFAAFVTESVGVSEQDMSAYYDTMAERFLMWPDVQMEAILQARQTLADGMTDNFGRANQWLAANEFIPPSNVDKTFQDAVKSFVSSIYKTYLKQQRQTRSPVDFKVDNTFRLILARINAPVANAEKRVARAAAPNVKPTPPPTAIETPEPTSEKENEPLKLVTCNINDHTITEGADELVEEFRKKTQPGDQRILRDLKNTFNFITRTDLPPTHRRGIKPIKSVKVRFGEDDKLWTLFEMKPQDAAGLSLSANNTVRDSRVYFIRLDDGSIGVVGIEPKKEQDAFLRRVREGNTLHDRFDT